MGAPRIDRQPEAAEGAELDLVVVGGGVYGVALTLEAARRGLRPLLVERDDFGGATSWNSHRIVHGGLRYLQSLDLARHRASVAERNWFLRHFPDLVRPLPCLMPLYGRGTRRPSVLRLGLGLDHLLSRHRNDGLRPDRRLPAGRVLSAAEAAELFPAVERDGLRGGALWYDAVMVSSQRLLVEMLRWACAAGAVCLNYVGADELDRRAGAVAGLLATDRQSGRRLRFTAPVVVNCAGPWSRQLAAAFDRDLPGLFRPSLAFNLLLDHPPLADPAVAVTPPEPGGHTYFLYGRHGRTYAGTAHETWRGELADPRPSEAEIGRVLDDLERAVPGLRLGRDAVLRVYAGLLPARSDGGTDLVDRPTIHDHRSEGGPSGAWSVSGVKFTTARRVAEQTLRKIFPVRRLSLAAKVERPAPRDLPHAASARGWLDDDPREAAATLGAVEREEAVLHLDDLLLRRVDWGEDPALARALAPRVCELLAWGEARAAAEITRLETDLEAAAAARDGRNG